MAIENIGTAAEGFDITKLIPTLDQLMGGLRPLLCLLVIVGPLVLLGLGLFYFLCPPKDANYAVGYRFRYSMSRVRVWRFTQRLAGLVYSGLGIVLTVAMLIVCICFSRMEIPNMVWLAAKCLLWQAGLIGAGTLGINITVMVLFDRKGNRRVKKQ